MHKTHSGFMVLVYDVIEPFRWLVDFTVFQIATNTSTKQRILLKEYAHTRNGNVVIEYSLTRRFLEMLERQFSQERKYESRYGRKTEDGLKSVSEIMIAKIAVQNLGEYCIKKNTIYST